MDRLHERPWTYTFVAQAPRCSLFFLLLAVFLSGVCAAEDIKVSIPEPGASEREEKKYVKNPHAWTAGDSVRQVLYLTLHAMDWGQTRNIAKNPDTCYEINPLFGRHPSVGKVNTIFIGSAVGHTVISYVLPKPYREYWQYITIGIKGTLVGYNFSMGIGVKF